MPVDKQSNGPTNKPITPALSSRFRSTKTPIAPRLAGSKPNSPALSRTKDAEEQPLSPSIERTQAQSLNRNVTPRSGARNARISTESPASPATNRRLSGTSSIQEILSPPRKTTTISSQAGFAASQSRLAAKSNSPSPLVTRRLSNPTSTPKKDEETTKFFRANEAKPASTLQTAKSTLSPRPLSTSFLKAGSSVTTASAPSLGNRNAKPEDSDQRFIRANDAAARAAKSPVVTRKQSTASISSTNSAKIRSPELVRTQSQPQSRSNLVNKTSPGRTVASSSTKSSPSKKPVPSQSSPAVVAPSSPSTRRLSFGNQFSPAQPPRPILHRKSASISAFSPPSPIVAATPLTKAIQRMESVWTQPNLNIPIPNRTLAIPTPDTLSPRSASLASSKTAATSITSDTDYSEVSKLGQTQPTGGQADIFSPASPLQPSQPTPLAQAQMNAANARRERKVLDLEISNSSLLAINKTLEKELRKQSAELRRFRRLSRSGRLSFAPSNRSVSAQTAMSLDTLREQSEDEEDFSEEEEESDFEELEDEIDYSLQDSPGGTTARARKRARDEKRLMNDLSKHQELLVDSQKLTQSIRKCLSISEDLIKEANQALKYKVGIGDLKLGGRVLSADDLDIDHDHVHHPKEQVTPRKALLSPSLTQTQLREVDLWSSNTRGLEEWIDRHLPGTQDPG